MADGNISATTGQKSRHSLDIDISAVLIAERLLGEILGWDRVDWSALEPHKSRKFFFGRQRQNNPTVYDQLKPFFDRCDLAAGDFSALKPSPVVNDNLTKLVGHLCQHIGRHSMPVNRSDGPVLERTIEQERLHRLVIDRLLCRIDGDPILDERATCLKTIAAAAENELEKHFVDLINDHLEKRFLSGGVPDRYKLDSLRDQAKGQIEETIALNARELAGLAMPELALDDDALIRIEMIKILLSRFPYVRNYELMLMAEIAMLQQSLMPRFVPARVLSGRKGLVDAELIGRWDTAIAGVASRIGLDRVTRSLSNPTSSQNRTVAICGSGPLPLSALFLHLLTGAKVVLIDQASAAVNRSRRLIINLERLEIVEPGALSVRQHEAGSVCFHSPDTSSEERANATVACDAVMIASLVDPSAKASIADHISRDPAAPDLLIMRSATGLSARLVYDALPTEALSQGTLAYCGETLPANQVAIHLDRIEAAFQRVACATSPDVLAIAHPDVVNTTEVYRKIPVAADGGGFSFSSGLTIEDWIERLQQVRPTIGNAMLPDRTSC